MVTDRYQHLFHHATVEDLVAWADAEGLPLVGIDNLPGATPLESRTFPNVCAGVRPGGSGPIGGSPQRGTGRLLDRPLRVNAVDQRRRGIGHRHARVDSPSRRGSSRLTLSQDDP
ncbi:MAG: hypothetical protein Ct9H300mP12_02370 [Acidimicrobiales bacterium]|nr:MAG: hypothetical protein Ct9H300mP12_02370 [Acidimicrobiales bacterium]